MLAYGPYSMLSARDVGKVKARLEWYAKEYPDGEWPGQRWSYPKGKEVQVSGVLRR